MGELGYQNRLDTMKRGLEILDSFKHKYSGDTMVYVYVKTFPGDKILTGEYYQNCGILTEECYPESNVTFGKQLWTIKHMTLDQFDDWMKKRKEEQDELDEKYPYLVNGGKYGYVYSDKEIKDKSYLKNIPV